VQNATRKSESAASEPTPRKSVAVAKKAKLPGTPHQTATTRSGRRSAHMSAADLVLKQVDSIDELFHGDGIGTARHRLVDARNQTDAAGVLSPPANAFPSLCGGRP